MSRTPDTRIPITLLTGFLGSGKTTLLNHLLRQPALAHTAVLINEIGSVPLDHHLTRTVSDQVVVLDSGCVCCTVRSDLAVALRDLWHKRQQGAIPPFQQIWIETTGLAKPGTLLQLLHGDEDLAPWSRLDGVVTTVDTVHGLQQLQQQPEARLQAALADRLILTKTDQASATQLAALQASLSSINPGASQHIAQQGQLDPDTVLAILRPHGEAIRRWVAAEPHRASGMGSTPPALAHDIRTFTLSYDDPLPEVGVHTALSMLLALHGDHVLRVKGLLCIAGRATPLVLHGVHHLLHEPM